MSQSYQIAYSMTKSVPDGTITVRGKDGDSPGSRNTVTPTREGKKGSRRSSFMSGACRWASRRESLLTHMDLTDAPSDKSRPKA